MVVFFGVFCEMMVCVEVDEILMVYIIVMSRERKWVMRLFY